MVRKHLLRTAFVTVLASGVGLAACGGDDPSGEFTEGDGAPSGGSSGTSGIGGSSGSGGDGGKKPCIPNASQFEVPGNDCDDDGDGQKDNAAACDGSLEASGNAADFVKALGLCKVASGDTDWGVISAEFRQGYSSADPPPAGQHGVLPKFGAVIGPREGERLGVLSTGVAREYQSLTGQPRTFKWVPEQPMGGGEWLVERPEGAWTFSPTAGALPPGFPAPAQGCPPPQNSSFDPIVLKIVIRTPKNANGLAFDFNFHSSEWPEFVCSPFNDTFVAYLTSQKSPGGAANISFDSQNNPVSVNLGFFDRCDPGVTTGCSPFGDPPRSNPKTSVCPGGAGELEGTGFGLRDEYGYCPGETLGGGATGWLTTEASIAPGETITLELVLADTGDPILDSSILLDNFRWKESETTTGTSRPPN